MKETKFFDTTDGLERILTYILENCLKITWFLQIVDVTEIAALFSSYHRFQENLANDSICEEVFEEIKSKCHAKMRFVPPGLYTMGSREWALNEVLFLRIPFVVN